MRNNASIKSGLREDILDLAKKGLSYRQIQAKLGCSKSTIAYHLGKGQKEKAKARRDKQRDNDIRYEPNRWQYHNYLQKKFKAVA
jgi:DNA invertase Pin-like site-specific DNA recombinase